MTHSKSHGDREPLLSGELWNEKPLQLHWAHDLTEPRPKASSLYWETNCEKHWSDEQTSRCDSGRQSQMSPSCNDIQSSTHSSRTAQKKIHDFVKSWDFSQTPEKQAGPQSFLMFFLCFYRFHLVPVLSVLAMTAERVFRSELCVSECAGCDQWLRADCVHSPWPNTATPSAPTQTLHST